MSRANGWYFVRIDDEWRPVEWVDGQFDASPMLCALILEVDERPISIAMHAENRQLRAKLAELESQAAIGRRAAEMLKDLEMSRPVIDANGFSGRGCLKCCGVRALGHKPGCELAAILRDAEQAQSSNGQGILDSSALEPATVAVDAGALAELREALRDLDDYWQHTPLMENNVMQHMASAARRLLAGIERQAAHDVTLTNEGNITDRQLADAVNELRDIAIKYHSAGQLRERIAGVVRGLVRGEPAPVLIGFDPAAPDGDKTAAPVVIDDYPEYVDDDAADGVCGRCNGNGTDPMADHILPCPDCGGDGRVLCGGDQ